MGEILAFFKSFKSTEIATFAVAVYGAVVASLNFAWPRLKEWKEGKTAIFRALQGEKEAIAEVAMQVIEDKWKGKLERSQNFRVKLIRALSMAFVLESSDRAKAYVVAAFEHIATHGAGKEELRKQLNAIKDIYEKYDLVVHDRDFREKRLGKLLAVISHFGK
jgi:hypothetical protein